MRVGEKTSTRLLSEWEEVKKIIDAGEEIVDARLVSENLISVQCKSQREEAQDTPAFHNLFIACKLTRALMDAGIFLPFQL